MEGKFTTSRTSEISPRIRKLQESLGFAPGESLTPRNFHRLIPAARDVHCIMGRHRGQSPVGSVQVRKAPTQPRLVPYFKVHKPKHMTNKKILPAIRRIKGDLKNSLGLDDSSNSNVNFDSESKRDLDKSNINKSFGESFLNKRLPYLSQNFSDSRSRKSWDIPNSNKESGFLNINKGINKFRSMRDFPVPQRNDPIGVKTLNKVVFREFSLFEHIGVSNSTIGVSRLNTGIDAKTLNKESDSSNSSSEFSDLSVMDDTRVENSIMDFEILNTKAYLSVSK